MEQYNKTIEEKIEPDVEDYGVYKLIISLSGTCSEGTINTSSETDFSVCVLNDTPNMHFGTLSREALGDEEEITLYPYGCAKLRMTEIPKI